ncbi:MAG: DUF4332 domain-containing protein [Gemmatimonadota bacterium]|nr:MAG: DUF4332 domain-containing protein [Gemmatimonadota bacterium]
MSEVVETVLDVQSPRIPSAAPRPRPVLVALPAFLFLAVASLLMLRRVEPFVNCYYISAWYPTLLLLDAAVAARTGRYHLLARPRFAISLLGWSAVLWFLFELINFRVANWYYVFLPPDRPARWIGTTVSFATVLPAILLAERCLATRGALEGIRWRPLRVTRRRLNGIFLAGVAFAVLSLAWPRLFFPLIWGALTLLFEPWNYRRDPRRSLLGDLAAGRPARLMRLLLGGLAIGFIWELYNIESRSKWVYTVPGFESFKLFEMPLLGFGGFPIFALDCFVVYQTLVLAGVAVAAERSAERGPPRLHVKRTVVSAAVAVAFSLAVLLGMDRWNTDSLRPELQEFWVAGAEARERLAATSYADLFELAAADPQAVATAAGVPPTLAAEWIAAAQLVTLRGIGTDNARLLWEAEVRSVADLAATNSAQLSERLQRMTDRPRAASPPKVRVWVRAAGRAVASGKTSWGAR